ncbi:hypothetical protein TL16_g08851 [Triparma laevis f. inornata]|uniref:Uncharacterized protein n=1 Tax=Triparma laevis f. inornata TaxID=1714386 RepID=A0A9W7B4Z1_9STRA|nr:hypothetical protein TL16_g08851 [Triparma laevis f. inornata]
MDPGQDDDDAPMMRLLHDNDQTDAQLERFIEAAAAKLSRQKARTLANNNVPVQRGVLARRLSYAGSSNPDQERENLEQMEVAVIKKKGWAGAEVKDVKELEEQLDGVIMNSSDIVGDVSSWFDLCYPEPPGDGTTARKNQKIFLTEIAKRNRTMKKMARIGVATKIIFTFVLGYVDILTDLLVAKSYYDIGNFGTAYSTATFSVTSITAQAIFTFKQYKKKGWRERLGRSLLAQLGLAPLMEGARVWTGKEDSDLLLSAPAMYACMKAIEICFESIPEAIIQVGGLLNAHVCDIKIIQIVGVISSIVSGAFIMTDGNFGFISSKALALPGDPYYGWIRKFGAGKKKQQMFGMFLFNACYFSQFVFSTSLFVQAFGRTKLFTFLCVEFCTLCLYLGWKRELFGFALVNHPSVFNTYFFPFFPWAGYYILTCAVPILISAAPAELGPEVLASMMVWRSLTNCGVIYASLGILAEKEHYLSLEVGMMGYAICLALASVGLTLFLMNCDENFDRSLFWKPKSGKQHARSCLTDVRIWKKNRTSKDEEFWAYCHLNHPAYLPFDVITPWICEGLVGKYEDKFVARPEWMAGENEEKFIKRLVEIYSWKDGEDGDVVNKALSTLFGRSGEDLEVGVDGQVTFIKTKRSKKSLGKVGPE